MTTNRGTISIIDLFHALDSWLESREARRIHESGSMACIYAQGLRDGLKDYFRGIWQKGMCPHCRSLNLRDKGSFDKCMDCGLRITCELVGSDSCEGE